MSRDDAELQIVQGMLSRERLAIDECDGKRTTFLTHVGATQKLAAGAWIAHRDLIKALARTRLSASQRHALARTVVADFEREFGVGRLRLEAVASGLPFGGASLSMQARRGGIRCLYTWSLAREGARARATDWLCLRAEADWTLERQFRALSVHGLGTLVGLGGNVALCVADVLAARQVAELVGDSIPLAAHPRFAPYLDRCDPKGSLLLWPHDAVLAPALERSRVSTMILVSAPEEVRLQSHRWAAGRPGVEVVEAGCPGRIDRPTLEKFWRACGAPKILLRGDPEWASAGRAWLEGVGATVVAHSRSTQLTLL